MKYLITVFVSLYGLIVPKRLGFWNEQTVSEYAQSNFISIDSAQCNIALTYMFHISFGSILDLMVVGQHEDHLMLPSIPVSAEGSASITLPRSPVLM